MASGGGGAWKVAFADFATAMMAFFLVMWATSQNKPVREAIAKYFEYPTSDVPTEEPAEELEFHGKPKPPPPKLRIFYELEQTQVVGTMVLFDEGSAELNDAGRTQLNALVPYLKGKPNKVEIRGHTSGRPLAADSPFKTTWDLCHARCAAAMSYLISQGIKPENIRLSQDGEHEPYSRQFGPEWQHLNSRVEVYCLSELAFQFKERAKETGGYFGPAENAPPKPAAEKKPGEQHGEKDKADPHGAAKPAAHGHAADSHGHKSHGKPETPKPKSSGHH